METRTDPVIPYRTTGEDLERFIEARARGRDLSQIKSLNYSKKSFNGTLLAAEKLNLLESETEDLTEAGQEFALAKAERRPNVLLEQVLKYEPYDLLLEAIFEQETVNETELEWIETWWSTQGFGSSGTNRSDGSTTFARFCEYLQLGDYLLGRHGKKSRIKWDENAKSRIEKFRGSALETVDSGTEDEVGSGSVASRSKQEKKAELSRESLVVAGENNTFSLTFSEGKFAKLSLPPSLKASEKQRLVSLVELMVAIDEGRSKDENGQLDLDI